MPRLRRCSRLAVDGQQLEAGVRSDARDRVGSLQRSGGGVSGQSRGGGRGGCCRCGGECLAQLRRVLLLSLRVVAARL